MVLSPMQPCGKRTARSQIECSARALHLEREIIRLAHLRVKRGLLGKVLGRKNAKESHTTLLRLCGSFHVFCAQCSPSTRLPAGFLGYVEFFWPGSKSSSHRCQSVYHSSWSSSAQRLSLSQSIPPIAPIHGFDYDYDHDNDRECDPEMNQAVFLVPDQDSTYSINL